MVRRLDGKAARSKLFVGVIFFSKKKDLVDRAKSVVEKEKLPNSIVSAVSGAGGFGGWQIAEEAEVTAVLYTGQRNLVANFAFRKGEFDAKAIDTILKKACDVTSMER